MKLTEVLLEVKTQLGANYVAEDEEALKKIVKRVIIQAASISNLSIILVDENLEEVESDNLLLLSPEIVDASCIAYLNRGTEGSKSKSELGSSDTFVDYTEKLRNDIIKNSKRIVR